jgi:hypothetical protein
MEIPISNKEVEENASSRREIGMHHLFPRRIAVSVVALFLVGGAGAGANTNSLMAWYTMEDANAAQLTDNSGNNRHAAFFPSSANHGYSTDAPMGAQSHEKKTPLIWQNIPNMSPLPASSACESRADDLRADPVFVGMRRQTERDDDTEQRRDDAG